MDPRTDGVIYWNCPMIWFSRFDLFCWWLKSRWTVNKEKQTGCLSWMQGMKSDPVMWGIVIINHYKDPYSTTSIQWKVRGFCLLRYFWRFFQVCLGLLGVRFEMLIRTCVTKPYKSLPPTHQEIADLPSWSNFHWAVSSLLNSFFLKDSHRNFLFQHNSRPQ